MATPEVSYHSEKFESLQLSPMWEEAAGHVDYQLSNPEGGSYRMALAETWRNLEAITQRSYMLIAVKKAEAHSGSRLSCRPSSAEVHMSLINNVFELLWMTASQCEDTLSSAGPSSGRRSPSNARLSLVNQMEKSIASAAVQPLSSAWHCLAQTGQKCTPRIHIDLPACQSSVPRSPSRSPVSPLARYPPLTAHNDPDDREAGGLDGCTDLGYSDESDVASDW